MSKKILVCLPDLWSGFTSGKWLYLSQDSPSRLLTHCGHINIPHEAISQCFPLDKSRHLIACNVTKNKDATVKIKFHMKQDWNTPVLIIQHLEHKFNKIKVALLTDILLKYHKSIPCNAKWGLTYLPLNNKERFTLEKELAENFPRFFSWGNTNLIKSSVIKTCPYDKNTFDKKISLIIIYILIYFPHYFKMTDIYFIFYYIAICCKFTIRMKSFRFKWIKFKWI